MNSRYPFVRLGDVLSLDLEEVSLEPAATYRTAGVYSFGRGLFPRPPISGSETAYSTYLRLHAGQIVLSRLFAWEGAVAYVTMDFEGYFVSKEFPTFTVNDARADARFLGYLMRWSPFHEELGGATRGLGLRRKRVHADQFLDVKVPLPARDEQTRVANRMEQIDHVLSEATRLSVRSMQLSGAIPSSLLNLTGPQRSLGQVLSLERDEVAIEPMASYRIAGIYSFGRGLFERNAVTGADIAYRVLFRLHAGTLVMSRLNAWEGALAVVDGQHDGCFVSNEYPTFAIDASQAVPSFIGLLCRWPSLWQALRDQARGLGSNVGARRLRVHPDQLLDTAIPLPDIPGQEKLVTIVDQSLAVARRVDSRAVMVEGLRSSLLNQAFAG